MDDIERWPLKYGEVVIGGNEQGRRQVGCAILT